MFIVGTDCAIHLGTQRRIRPIFLRFPNWTVAIPLTSQTTRTPQICVENSTRINQWLNPSDQISFELHSAERLRHEMKVAASAGNFVSKPLGEGPL